MGRRFSVHTDELCVLNLLLREYFHSRSKMKTGTDNLIRSGDPAAQYVFVGRLGENNMGRIIILCSAAVLLIAVGGTPLDDYVNAPDSHYKYEEVSKPFEGDGYKTYFLNMTSQKWLNGEILQVAWL